MDMDMDMDIEASAKVNETKEHLAARRSWWTTIMSKELAKKLASEFLGTFILLYGAAGSSIMQEKTHGEVTYLGVGVAAGLVVMAVIFATGHISGAHINPAVTIAFATFKHFPWLQVPLYIIAQVLGSISSSFVLISLLKVDQLEGGGVTYPSGSEWQSLLVEFFLTVVLVFVVTAVSTDTRAVGELAGIAVGITVILNNIVAGSISGASMNPVRSLGPAVATSNFKHLWVYIIGPTCGAVVGAGLYSLIKVYKENSDGQDRISSFRHFS